MKIGLLTHAYPRWDGDPPGAFLERLVLALVARGHQVEVIAPADAGTGGVEVRPGVRVTRLRYAPARVERFAYRGRMVAALRSPLGLLGFATLVLRQALTVRRLWKQGRLDVVHAHWWVPGGLSAWLSGVPYVVTLHGMDVVLLESSAFARRLGRRVLRRAAVVTAVSSDLARRAARTIGVDPAAIMVQPMPIELGQFTHLSRGGGGAVTVGRLQPRKRLSLLLEALAQLRTDGLAISLTIIGDGPERSRLEAQAAALGLTGSVRFLGEVPPARVPGLIGDADVFAFPALGEGLGLVAVEALLLGVPVVAARDGGGVVDVVPESGGGCLVMAEPRALAEALRALVSDPAARPQAAARGEALRRRFDAAVAAERFEALYRQVVESRSERTRA